MNKNMNLWKVIKSKLKALFWFLYDYIAWNTSKILA